MASLFPRLKALLKGSLPIQYAYRKWLYPLARGRADTDELLIPHLAIRTGIDVGANAGTYALALAPVCQRLLCFEPVPFMQRLLQHLLGRTAHVSLFEDALSDTNGVANLSIPVREGGSETALATMRTVFPQSRNLEVKTLRLDDFWQQHPAFDPATVDFIKIDVEGVEDRVLAGMQATLARARPVLLIEIELRHNPASVAIFSALTAQGYRTYVSRVGGQLSPVDITSDADLHALQDADDIAHERFSYGVGDERRYLNNFWFIHPQSALAGTLTPFIRAH